MKMGWNCHWLVHWHVKETRAKWHVMLPFAVSKWGDLLHLNGVFSCTFEAGFNKCQIVLFWVSRWGVFLHIWVRLQKCQIVLFWVSKWGVFLHVWGRIQQMPDCTLLSLKVGWILAHFKTLDHDMSNSFEIFACMLHADLDTKKFNKFSNPNFCAACQSCMQCAQKLMRGYQTLTLCHFFYEKEEVLEIEFFNSFNNFVVSGKKVLVIEMEFFSWHVDRKALKDS